MYGIDDIAQLRRDAEDVSPEARVNALAMLAMAERMERLVELFDTVISGDQSIAIDTGQA